MTSEDSLTVGQMAELGQLFDEHRVKLISMLRRRIDPSLSVRIDAEDVLSEAFIQARGRWLAYKEKPKTTPYAWLYRIALDCLFQAWRKEARGKRDLRRDMPFPEHSSMQLGMNLVSPGTTPTEAVRREETRERVRQTMQLLSERDQEVLWMRHFDQLSFKEMADVLGIKHSTASVRYVRALERLRRLWEQIDPQPGADR